MKTYKVLSSCAVGFYPCRRWFQFWRSGGWIGVSRDESGKTTAIWTSEKGYHNRLNGRAQIIMVSEFGNLVGYFEAILWVHLKWSPSNPDRQNRLQSERIAEWMECVIEGQMPVK